MSDEVLSERHGKTLVITMNRPAARNAINHALADQLIEAMARLDADDTLAVGVLTGAGGAFCAGVDLKAVAEHGRPSHVRRVMEDGSTKPLIAAVEGAAVAGGLELALACDLLVAGRGARFGIPEARVGLVAAGGALARLPVRMSYGMAMEMALTGRLISAEEALEHRLVQQVVETGGALAAACAMAESISVNAPLSVRASKQLIRRGIGLTEPEYWAMQADHAPAVFASDDAKEGPRSFAARRPPVWAGR
jgi:enoyl-CoA hydratase